MEKSLGKVARSPAKTGENKGKTTARPENPGIVSVSLLGPNDRAVTVYGDAIPIDPDEQVIFADEAAPGVIAAIVVKRKALPDASLSPEDRERVASDLADLLIAEAKK